VHQNRTWVIMLLTRRVTKGLAVAPTCLSPWRSAAIRQRTLSEDIRSSHPRLTNVLPTTCWLDRQPSVVRSYNSGVLCFNHIPT